MYTEKKMFKVVGLLQTERNYRKKIIRLETSGKILYTKWYNFTLICEVNVAVVFIFKTNNTVLRRKKIQFNFIINHKNSAHYYLQKNTFN